jgi:hypothetical protein
MKIRTRSVLVASVAVALMLAISVFSGVKSTTADDGGNLLVGTCPGQGFLHGPSGGQTVLNIAWKAKNDEDSGLKGYWALDYFVEHLTVWKLPDRSFYALKSYLGVFSTPQGAISPGSSGTQALAENSSAFGSIVGGYVATFTGTFNPGTQQVSGFIGTKDYGGTVTDILKGYYVAGQTGPIHTYSWTGAYFTSVDKFVQPHWGWAYQLSPVFRSATSINQWCNYNTVDGGNSGDIYAPP